MVKEWGFYESRRREVRRRAWGLRRLPCWFWAAALFGLLWVFGLTQAWPQSSGSSSSSSSSDLETWETLSSGYKTALSGQSMLLEQALRELETSRPNLRRLTDLSEQLSKANERLRSYNGQMAERMQHRDKELAKAYGDIGRIERQRLQLIIAVAILAGFLCFIISMKLVKFFK